MMFSKEDAARSYQERKVAEEFQKLESLLVLADAINYLSQKPEEIVKEALDSLRQKRMQLGGSEKLQLLLFAEVPDPDNPRLDVLLPIKPQMSVQGVGKALFGHVSSVLGKHTQTEVTDFNGYVDFSTGELPYSLIDATLLELSIIPAELTRYGIEFGIFRQYKQLNKMPSSAPKRERGEIERPYLQEYMGYIEGVGAQGGRLSIDEGEDPEIMKSRLVEAAEQLGKKISIRDDKNGIYFSVERTSKALPISEGRKRRPGNVSGSLPDRIEAYIKQNGPADVSALHDAMPDIGIPYIRATLSLMSNKQGRLQRLQRGLYGLPKTEVTQPTGSYQHRQRGRHRSSSLSIQIKNYIGEHGPSTADTLMKAIPSQKPARIRSALNYMSSRRGELVHEGHQYSLPKK